MLVMRVVWKDCAERLEEVGFWVWVFSGGGRGEGDFVCEQHGRGGREIVWERGLRW